MKQIIRQFRTCDWLIIAALPFVLYPAFLAVAALHGWLAGDSVLLTDLRYGSKGQLLREMLGGWKDSLPVSVVVSLGVFLPACLLAARGGLERLARVALAGAVAGLLLGAWVYLANPVGMALMAGAGCLAAFGLFLVTKVFGRWCA